MAMIAAKAICFKEALDPSFKEYAQQVVKNAKRLADELMKRDFKLITNGTDNHMMVANVWQSFKISGKKAEGTLDKIHLTLNKNVIPDDPRKPSSPSGIRLGTPAITTRGMKEDDMEKIAEWMHQAIINANDDVKLADIAEEVKAYCLQFPLPSDR